MNGRSATPQAEGGRSMKTSNNSTVTKQPLNTDGRVGRELMLLIDEFEEFLDQRPRIPLTGKIMFDEDDLYGFVDHLRRAVPAEIKRAMEVLAERDRIIQSGETEAENMVAEARQYVERLTDESVVLRQAEEEAARIVALAKDESDSLRQDADKYAQGMLEKLEGILTEAILQVRQGQQLLANGEDEGDEVPSAISSVDDDAAD